MARVTRGIACQPCYCLFNEYYMRTLIECGTNGFECLVRSVLCNVPITIIRQHGSAVYVGMVVVVCML